jgi:hypothetical protein
MVVGQDESSLEALKHHDDDDEISGKKNTQLVSESNVQ